ncbi:TPA: hypothetical protein ACPZ0W_000725 [Enterobacter bugandensis]|uniref:hypothetical protein n=1 Tax=Enterobacter TaxID=547 RepID=UPI000AB8DAAE|nr:hypothetical protein [Enterobacter bugandensis]MCK1122733.1 hypothetical protein [Enterobacter bugandensis]HAS1308971.1 hypothetical protein [Enterobacter bugandensis]HBM7584317.1 hypothetical protein [Enterobacter bugandensis]HBM7618509.1 hypothetical protein [Enterobacter bugandensis]HCD1870214.1 hypothetical protein [Enterobacter bugandensis]
MSSMDMDMVSKRLNKSLDIIFLRHPIRTAFGFFVGYIIFMCVYTIRNIIAANWFDVDSVHYVGCFVLGVVLMHTNTIIDAYNGTALDERLSTLLKTVEKRTDLSKDQKRIMVISILNQEIKSLTSQELDAAEKGVADE